MNHIFPSLVAAALILFVTGEAGASYQTYLLEAEACSEVIRPATVVERDGARGGKCVQMSTVNAREHHIQGGQDPEGQVTFNLNIEEQGIYYFWIRVLWHCYCSRDLALSTSGTLVQDRNDSQQALAVVSDESRPLEWHWLQTYRIALAKGPAMIRLDQRGHASLVDSIAISTDSQYLPPGYCSPDEQVTMATVDFSTAKSPENGDILLPLSDRYWGDFRIEAVLEIPQSSDVDGQVPRLGFLLQPEDKAYAQILTFSRSETGGLFAELIQRHAKDNTVLAKNSLPTERVNSHFIDFRREGHSVTLDVDGLPTLNSETDMLSPEKIAFFSERLSNPTLAQLSISKTWKVEQYFTQGIGDWREIGGRWHQLPPSSQSDVAGVMCDRTPIGFLRSPWPPTNALTVRTKLKLLAEGRAGIGFCVGSTPDIYGVVLASPEQPAGGLHIQVNKITSGKSQVLRTYSCRSDPNQWHELEVQYSSGSIKFSLDDKVVGLLGTKAWTGDITPGFLCLPGGTALFASAIGSQHVDILREEYIFELFCDARALAHWYQREGRFTLVHHPAELRIEPRPEDEGNILLEYKRPLGHRIEFSVEVSIPPNLQTAIDDLSPPVKLPVLPEDPVIGLEVIIGEANLVSYRVSSDTKRMQTVVITRNGVKVGQSTDATPTQGKTTKLYLRIQDGQMIAGLSGRAEASVADTEFDSLDGHRKIRVFGKYLSPNTPILIHAINVMEIPETVTKEELIAGK